MKTSIVIIHETFLLVSLHQMRYEQLEVAVDNGLTMHKRHVMIYFTKPPLRLWYSWIIASHPFMKMYLFGHTVTWLRHQMETFSALLALCAGWPGALMFSLICALNKRMSKQSWSWWFETSSRSLWRHRYDFSAVLQAYLSSSHFELTRQNDISRMFCVYFRYHYMSHVITNAQE